ncbi:hypothetical protein LPJ59_005095 [Coemansia sp. RSA 2399]|nr:hypothetical protein LPJ59_005095 [Coemansia sp. RSA 2399]
MDTADSDSDDFFSDIRALRRQFGISNPKTLASKVTPKRPVEQKSTTAINDIDLDVKPGRKRANTPTPSSAERLSKKPSATVAERSSNSPTHTLSLGSVSPGEIAALLSPRKQRQRAGCRLLNRRRSSGIPPRTPESRIASPQAPLFSLKPTPAPTPTKKPLSETPKRGLKESVSTSASPVSFSGFNMRSIWSKETSASPLHTPSGQRLRLSPVGISKRSPHSGGFKSLAFRLDTSEPASNESGSFGLLGSVEEALVTDSDLEASRRKLGEEYALTQQQIIREVRDRIMAFSCSSDAGLGIPEWRDSVSMLCQFYTLGHGRLAFTKQGIVWCGYMLGPLASVSQASDMNSVLSDYNVTANTTLLFPWTRVTSLRRKDIDDSCFVMATVDHDLGVAFNVGEQPHEPSSDIDAMVAKMNALLSDVQRDESLCRIQESASEPVNEEYTQNGIGYVKGRDVIRIALDLAKSHDKRFADLDVSKALNANGFMADATSSALEFSLIMATKAVASMGSVPKQDHIVVDDPGTESLPGVCTLCYAENESVVFRQCDHRVCCSCFSHLRVMYPSSSQQPSSSDAVCVCPWDRTEIASWSTL